MKKSWGVPASKTTLLRSQPTDRHIIHLALNWHNAMKTGNCTAKEIAAQVDFSDHRVRQIVRLANLHPKIIDHLQALKGKKKLRKTSEKSIRSIASLPVEEQIAAFETKTGAQIRA